MFKNIYRSFSSSSSSSVLVYGGNGALGKSIISHYNKLNWKTISVDFHENNEAYHNVVINSNTTWNDNVNHIISHCNDLSQSKSPVQSIISVAGGWLGGDITNKNIMQQFDQMYDFNVRTSVTASHIASKSLSR